MARINIDESLFKDPRFTELCIKMGSRRLAVGALVEVWFEAQVWWKGKTHHRTKEVLIPARSGIPSDRFHSLGFAKEIIDCGLAKIIDGAVFISGAEEQFAWLMQRVDAGKQPKNKKDENHETHLKSFPQERDQAETSGLEPLPPTPSLVNYNINLNNNNSSSRQKFEILPEISDPDINDKLCFISQQAQRRWLRIYKDPKFIKAVIRNSISYHEANGDADDGLWGRRFARSLDHAAKGQKNANKKVLGGTYSQDVYEKLQKKGAS